MKHFLVCILLSFLTFSSYSQKPYSYIENGKRVTISLNELKDFVNEGFVEMCKQMNSQCPFKTDETTTLKSMYFANNELVCNYRVDIDSSKYPKEYIDGLLDILRKNQSKTMRYLMVEANSDLMPKEEWIRLYKEMGLKLGYIVSDNKGVVFGKITLDYNDLK